MENIFSKNSFMFFILFLISLIFVFTGFDFINADSDANDTMIVEVNLLGFGNASETPEIAIEVPDYIFLGNVSKDDPVSNESDKMWINSTGTANITIMPQIDDPNEKIFQYLFFKRITSDSWKRIGNWSLDIDKPKTGKGKGQFYVRLDLRNFNGNINEDIIGYTNNVVFYAMKR